MIKVTEGKNNKKNILRIVGLKLKTETAIRAALHTIGQSHVVHARMLMDKSKSGKQYKINWVSHTASAPGEAPASVTGSLKKSIDYTVGANRSLTFGYRSRSGMKPYGKHLEFGTPTIEPRPNIFETAKDKREETHKTLYLTQKV